MRLKIHSAQKKKTLHKFPFSSTDTLFFFQFFLFCCDKSPFCGATGSLCFGLLLTLPMGVKARVDTQSPVLFSLLRVITLRVNSADTIFFSTNSYCSQLTHFSSITQHVFALLCGSDFKAREAIIPWHCHKLPNWVRQMGKRGTY